MAWRRMKWRIPEEHKVEHGFESPLELETGVEGLEDGELDALSGSG